MQYISPVLDAGVAILSSVGSVDSLESLAHAVQFTGAGGLDTRQHTGTLGAVRSLGALLYMLVCQAATGGAHTVT